MANLSGLTAAEVGFLMVKPFKKHSLLAVALMGTDWECSLCVCSQGAADSKNRIFYWLMSERS